MGNRVAMDSSASSGSNNFDEQYAYDALNRLTDYRRGVGTTDLNSDSRADVVVLTGTDLKFRQQWTLDALGNWASFSQDSDGSGGGAAVTQTRVVNLANEIDTDNTDGDSDDPITGVSWIDPIYDKSGNMTKAPKVGAETTAVYFKYDGWNRLAGFDANGDGDTTDNNDYRWVGGSGSSRTPIPTAPTTPGRPNIFITTATTR